jgi:hypothetical protein
MGAHEYCPSLGACYPTAIPTRSRTQNSDQSVALESTLKVNMHPNPVQDILNIELSEKSEVQVSIFNAIGQLMTSESFSGSKVKIDFSSYPAGLYTVSVNDQITQSVHRIIKN